MAKSSFNGRPRTTRNNHSNLEAQRMQDLKALVSQVKVAQRRLKRPVEVLEILTYGSQLNYPVDYKKVELTMDDLDKAAEFKIDGIKRGQDEYGVDFYFIPDNGEAEAERAELTKGQRTDRTNRFDRKARECLRYKDLPLGARAFP